jgi:hypothetical protein
MSGSRADGWFFRNQIGGLSGQLVDGVRAFMLDLHYGARTQNVVRTDFADDVDVTAARAQGAALARSNLSLIEQLAVGRALGMVGADVPDDLREVYLCHVLCELGATRAVDAFRTIDDYLRSNPYEVVILILEDHVAPADAVEALEDGGLAEHAYAWVPGTDLPTLEDMIEMEKNVLVLVEENGGLPNSPAWYHDAYGGGLLQDTPYRFEATSEFSCELDRGRSDAPLFLINHWVSAAPPSPAVAERVNRTSVLEGRVAECDGVRRRPNIIAVDFWSRGDVGAYVAGLNGVNR